MDQAPLAQSSSSGRQRSVAGRVTGIGVGMITVVLLALGALVASVTNEATRKLQVASVEHATQALALSIDGVEDANRDMVVRATEALARKLPNPMSLDPVSGDLVANGMVINNDFTVVDAFSDTTGGVATVFARQGDDFVRITTSLRDSAGKRVLGTQLDRSHPAYAQLQSGASYTGRANLFGKPFMTHYLPTRDASGKVIGALFVGMDLTAFEQGLRQQVAQLQFFEHGGAMVIAPGASAEDAIFVAHPTHSGRRVLEAYPQMRHGLNVLRSSAQAVLPTATPMMPNQGGDPWAVLRTTQSGWWVISEVSDDEAMGQQHRVLYILLSAVGAALVLLGVGLFVTLRRGVSEPLHELTRTITLVAEGDLTQRFHSTRKDEVGALVREVELMRQRYVAMLRQVSVAAHSIASASSQIALGNADLAERTESTAVRLARSSQGITEMSDGVHRSADAAQQAHALSASAVDVASRGGAVVGQVVSTMGDINDSSRRIGDIIGVIDSIAFQTNILALNAAVEAARAGEQGRGFAVVAGEVRLLAQRSAEAAKEIKGLITDSLAKVDSGAAQVQAAGQTMDEIVHSVQQVGDIIGEIAASASQQSARMAEVNRDVSELDQMTQQNAALVEESAAASNSMRDQAVGLESAVAVFKLPADGNAAGAVPAMLREGTART